MRSGIAVIIPKLDKISCFKVGTIYIVLLWILICDKRNLKHTNSSQKGLVGILTKKFQDVEYVCFKCDWI